MTNVNKIKVEAVDKLSKKINDSNVTAVVSIKGIRAKQLQEIRRKTKDTMDIKVTRRKLFFKSIEKTGNKKLDSLIESSKGQIAIVTSNSAPTEVFKTIIGTMQKSAPRGGEIAPEDIIVEPSVTSFPPGPMMTEFQKIGLTTGVEKGKISIKKEAVLVKKGQVIPKDVAKIISILDIKPIDVGLQLFTLYSDGIIFTPDVLSLTPEKISQDLAVAYTYAKVMAKSAGYFTSETIEEFITGAKISADAIAVAATFITEENVKTFIAKAGINAIVLNNEFNKGIEKESESQKTKEEKKD
ncbi:MAG: 50S ribosomal protein L10 [Thermoplasmata archaeon]